MFPIPWNKAYRKKDGTLVNMEDLSEGGGGGGSFTPDYENEILEIGTVDNWKYYIPMSKRYVGPGISGYEITTNPDSTSSAAKIDLYSIIYNGGQVLDKIFIQTLVHNGVNSYSNDNLEITYTGNNWRVVLKVPMYNAEGTVYESPILFHYATPVDYIMLTEDPTV